MASSEDPRKRALADEDNEDRKGLGPTGHGEDDDAQGGGASGQGQGWSGKTDLQDSTQVMGKPAFTSDDPAGFGETTQAMRFDTGSAHAPGDFESEPTRVGTTSDWSGAAPPEEETRPGRGSGAPGTLGEEEPADFRATTSAGSFGRVSDEHGSPSSSSGGLPEFGASGTGATLGFDFGSPPSSGPYSSDTTDPGHPKAAAPSSDLPAHLQLPAMDFSLPQLPDFGSAPASGDLSGSELPANLQLPTFPDLGLGLPPLGTPGEGNAPAGPPDPGERGAEAGPPGTPPRRRTGEAPPPPPPRRTTSQDQPLPTAFGMPEDLALPDLAPPPSKRNLTLISMPQDSDDDAPRRVIWPFVVIAVLAASTVVGVWQKDRLLAVLVPKKKPPAPVVVAPTPQEQAKVAFAGGVHAFAAKEYPKAIESFEKALALDGTMADAHRSLGIVYATTHEQAKAVEHYRRYLELMPKSPEAPAVQKIVDDYAKAQAKPAMPPPPEEPEKTKQKGKKAKGKRR